METSCRRVSNCCSHGTFPHFSLQSSRLLVVVSAFVVTLGGLQLDLRTLAKGLMPLTTDHLVEKAKLLALSKNNGNFLQDFIWQTEQLERVTSRQRNAPVDKQTAQQHGRGGLKGLVRKPFALSAPKGHCIDTQAVSVWRGTGSWETSRGQLDGFEACALPLRRWSLPSTWLWRWSRRNWIWRCLLERCLALCILYSPQDLRSNCRSSTSSVHFTSP